MVIIRHITQLSHIVPDIIQTLGPRGLPLDHTLSFVAFIPFFLRLRAFRPLHITHTHTHTRTVSVNTNHHCGKENWVWKQSPPLLMVITRGVRFSSLGQMPWSLDRRRTRAPDLCKILTPVTTERGSLTTEAPHLAGQIGLALTELHDRVGARTGQCSEGGRYQVDPQGPVVAGRHRRAQSPHRVHRAAAGRPVVAPKQYKETYNMNYCSGNLCCLYSCNYRVRQAERIEQLISDTYINRCVTDRAA